MAIASEVKGHHIQAEGALDALRFEAMRIKNLPLVADIDNYITARKHSLDTFAVIEKELAELPTPSGDPRWTSCN